MGCLLECFFEVFLEVIFELIFQLIVELANFITPGTIFTAKTRRIFRNVTAAVLIILFFVLIFGFLFLISNQQPYKTIGQYMTYIPLGIFAVNICLGIVLRTNNRSRALKGDDTQMTSTTTNPMPVEAGIKTNILFDLDGTLTDSGEGIINCAIAALEHFGLPVPERTALRTFVGPPLRDSFPKFGVPADKVDEAIDVYRKRYVAVGKFENFPYPGIREMLEELKAKEHRLYVATSKPEHMAIVILEHFELAQYFELICGATPDDSRSKKEDVIAYLLDLIGHGGIMVGDTIFDVEGAKANNLLPIAVTWGYGDIHEMEQAGAKIVHSTEELLQMIEKEAC